MRLIFTILCLLIVVGNPGNPTNCLSAAGRVPQLADVEGQPLGANIARLMKGLRFLGKPLPRRLTQQIDAAIQTRDAERLQELLDPQVLFVVSLNPEVRVKVQRGPAAATLTQTGFTPVLIKIINQSTVTRQLRILSPQSGPVYAGAALGILKRQAQTELNKNENKTGDQNRFLVVEMFQSPPMTRNLSGLAVEYAIGLIYSNESGQREATIGFDVGAGSQDLGFRGEVPVLFDVQPALPVKLSIRDHDGRPTMARLTIRDHLDHVVPPQAKRLAPDFFFQPQIYRADGEVIPLSSGTYEVEYTRGPEYVTQRKRFTVSPSQPSLLKIDLKRWIHPLKHGYASGDHHIHGAGCSHYTQPTEGVTPADMFRQVKGEGLNVGCVLTWGPCFDYQRRFFSPIADEVSEPLTLLKYDLEISGFGSAALGHVCLLNLKDQTFPGSQGTKQQGWPTWTVPVMRWAKQQGGVTGFPHSAMIVNPESAAQRMMSRLDRDADGQLSTTEVEGQLLPESFQLIDQNQDRFLSQRELIQSHDRAADELPNLAVPEMNGAGSLEICVAVAEGVCDFISAMDTRRVSEWNTWYHLMNCGFPLKVSGETDFPCMSSRRVGQGRVYVQMEDVKSIDFKAWCEGIAAGRSYVSDGFAHAIGFNVEGHTAGNDAVHLEKSGTVKVHARVAFAENTPMAVAYGTLSPTAGRRVVGDTIDLHAPRREDAVSGGSRTVELIVNGVVVAARDVPADGQLHVVDFTVPIDQSSWIALRQFPQLHTNPVDVLIDKQPIRASNQSARWCAETVRQLWERRHAWIDESERPAAKTVYDRARATYARIAAEATSRGN